MVRRIVPTALLLVFILGCASATQDDFKREGEGSVRAQKDALENKPPPALQLSGWINTGGEALTLEGLKGKVVVLDFWGVW